MPDVIEIIGIAFWGIYSIVIVVLLCRQLVDVSRNRRYARISIGDEVSIRHDKGAMWAYKGVYAFMNSDYSKSIEHFEKAMGYSMVSHNNAFCLDWMSQCYDALEKPQDSLRCCIKAVDVEPSNVKSLFNLADMYAKIGVFDKAEFYYNRILRYDSKNTAATFMLGTLHMGRGRYDEAQEQFLKTLEIDERFTAAMVELSVIMAIKGEYGEMDSYYKKVSDKPYIETDRLRRRLDSIKKMRDLCYDNK